MKDIPMVGSYLADVVSRGFRDPFQTHSSTNSSQQSQSKGEDRQRTYVRLDKLDGQSGFTDTWE